MRNLTISVSDLELNKFGIKKEKILFSEFVDLVSKELAKQALAKSVGLAEKYQISKMTMMEITREVKALRKNAKNRN